MKNTGFFEDEFIANYKKIIQTLDKKIKNKEFEAWNIYQLPTFNFANDVNPWCLCQDVPYDKPNPYDFVIVEIIHFDKDKAELNWKWGKLKENQLMTLVGSNFRIDLESLMKITNGKFHICKDLITMRA